MIPPFSLGVDILERKKAGVFYDRHQARLATLLNPNELAYLRTSVKPREAFTMIFSAKEAVFKALGGPVLGIAGFRDVQLFPQKNFSVKLKGAFKKNVRTFSGFKVSFKKTRYHIVATCHPRAVTPCAGT